VRKQQFLRNVQAIRDALFRAASELDQLVNEITSGEHAMRPPDRAQATASVGAYEHSALEKYRRTLDAVMEILQKTRAEQPCDLVNAGEPEISDSRSALDPSNHHDKRTTTLQAIKDELRQTMESLRSANDAICSADQTIEMLTQALVARHTGDPSSPCSEPLSGMPGGASPVPASAQV
jgi:phosphoenolpyruvate carboxylase